MSLPNRIAIKHRQIQSWGFQLRTPLLLTKSVMFQLQFVIGLFIGFNFDIIHKVLNSPINAENDLDLDYYGAKARSLFDDPDRSMNEDEAYSEKELENIFSNPDELDDISIENELMFEEEKPRKLWPNGVIPYEIGPMYKKRHIKLIKLAIEELVSKTSLRFPERTVEEDYIYFFDRKGGCSSPIGHQGGQQFINLHIPSCFKKFGTIVHEILHSVSFVHEQARTDRDDYVKIFWNNIIKEQKKNYGKSKRKVDPNVDLTYDFSSIMHYPRYGFAINPLKPTMVPLVENEESSKMGQRTGLSPLDIKKINLRYQYEFEKRGDRGDRADDSGTNVHFALKTKTFLLEFNFTSSHEEEPYINMTDLSKA